MVIVVLHLKRLRNILVTESTTMKKTYSKNKPVLYPLKKKFKDAGCECLLTIGKHQTILTISYANIIPMTRPTRSAG